MLQRLTLADETMCSRLGSWRRESQCLEDGRWKMEVNIFGPQSLPWGSTATAQVWVGDELLPLPADSPGLRAVWDEQNGNVFLREI